MLQSQRTAANQERERREWHDEQANAQRDAARIERFHDERLRYYLDLLDAADRITELVRTNKEGSYDEVYSQLSRSATAIGLLSTQIEIRACAWEIVIAAANHVEQAHNDASSRGSTRLNKLLHRFCGLAAEELGYGNERAEIMRAAREAPVNAPEDDPSEET